MKRSPVDSSGSREPGPWHCRDEGTGRPLILLHGIGMSHAAWAPVIPFLSASRRVVAFDSPGFGSTPSLGRGMPATIHNLVTALERALHLLRLETPVDIAGNSLGATMALEASRRGLARRVVAISPPGLWLNQEPSHVKYVFAGLRLTATTMPRVMKAAMRVPFVRELSLAIPLSVGSRRMPAAAAAQCVDDLARATAFEDTFTATRTPFRGHDIQVPVTVVFGGRDWILTEAARLRRALPPHTRWIERAAWGHVPMWVDPAGVARVILESLDRCPQVCEGDGLAR